MASSPDQRTAHEILCDEEAAAARQCVETYDEWKGKAGTPGNVYVDSKVPEPNGPRIQRIEDVLHGRGVVEREDTQ